MKEEILKEFKILSEKEHRELTKGCFYQDELRDNYNKIIKILAQTREETIMEVEEILPGEANIHTEFPVGWNNCRREALNRINKLKK